MVQFENFIPGTRTSKKVDEERVFLLTKELLLALGYQPDLDPDILDTPKRVAKFWREFLDYDPGNYRTSFKDGESYNQMVVVSEIKFTSMCSHHLLPFLGEGIVGYLSKGKVLGLSKIPRIFQEKAHSLQMQERIGRQTAETIMQVLGGDCLGVAVVIKATHTCMCSRGPREYSPTTTRYMTGLFRNDPLIGREFYTLAGLD